MCEMDRMIKLDRAFANLPNHKREDMYSRVTSHPLCPENLRDPNSTHYSRYFAIVTSRHNPTQYPGGAPWAPLSKILESLHLEDDTLISVFEDILLAKKEKQCAREILEIKFLIGEDVGSVVASFLSGLSGSLQGQLEQLCASSARL